MIFNNTYLVKMSNILLGVCLLALASPIQAAMMKCKVEDAVGFYVDEFSGEINKFNRTYDFVPIGSYFTIQFRALNKSDNSVFWNTNFEIEFSNNVKAQVNNINPIKYSSIKKSEDNNHNIVTYRLDHEFDKDVHATIDTYFIHIQTRTGVFRFSPYNPSKTLWAGLYQQNSGIQSFAQALRCSLDINGLNNQLKAVKA